MLQGNAVTDFLVLVGAAAFFFVTFVVIFGDLVGVVAGRRALVDRIRDMSTPVVERLWRRPCSQL